MDNGKKTVFVLTLAIIALAPALAAAQVPMEGAVSSSGSASIKKAPEFLRLQIELLAKGKDLKEALANLETRRKAAQTQLVTLGADKATIEIGDPAVTAAKTSRQMQMEMMIQQRRGAKAKKPGKEEKPPVTVGVSCKADFPLKSAAAGELLLTATELQEKIKAADISGLKEMEKASPKDEEAAEENQEMAMNMGYYDGSNEMKPGEPAFMYVSKISDEEREKAMAEAFQKARKEAAVLAKAAGVDLGNLQHLSNSFQFGDSGDAMERMNNPYAYQMMQRAQYLGGGDAESQPREAVGVTPTKVTMRVNVAASFTVKGSHGK